jgi:hypothetical protein
LRIRGTDSVYATPVPTGETYDIRTVVRFAALAQSKRRVRGHCAVRRRRSAIGTIDLRCADGPYGRSTQFGAALAGVDDSGDTAIADKIRKAMAQME